MTLATVICKEREHAGCCFDVPLIFAIILTLGWRAAFYLAGAVGIGLAIKRFFAFGINLQRLFSGA